MLLRQVDKFMSYEALAGILLILTTAAALIFSNTELAPFYERLRGDQIAVTLNGQGFKKPLILWVNDGLMAIFFLMVGLELKRELVAGKLRDWDALMLPGLAAIGGMAVPALIYVAFTFSEPRLLNGWAIPAATDIAFAIGLLSLLGRRVPVELKLFLLTLAILDDIGAILIIAVFYTQDLHFTFLIAAAAPLAAMVALNLSGSHRHGPYLALGLILWMLVVKSGVHATLAGVALAFCVPMTDRFESSPLRAMEDAVTPYVLFGVMPIFAFMNAGVALGGLSLDDVLAPVPLGVAAGLFLGKQLGVFGFAWATVATGLARLPRGVGWGGLYGVACLAGIGFTMSLFIGALSFPSGPETQGVRIGVLAGSFACAVVGLAVLYLTTRAPSAARAGGETPAK